jgi:hypothetical protein
MATGERQERGVGVIEAPRGTLIHHYRVDENDQVMRANLIVSTTHNNQAMNTAVREVAQAVPRRAKLTEGLLNHIEVAIRAFDPCLSCATHALGQMPLEVPGFRRLRCCRLQRTRKKRFDRLLNGGRKRLQPAARLVWIRLFSRRLFSVLPLPQAWRRQLSERRPFSRRAWRQRPWERRPSSRRRAWQQRP